MVSAMVRFCEAAWAETADLRRAIHTLPFVLELTQGTLDRDRFRFYIQQDAIYLGRFARVLAMAAARAPDTAILQNLAHAALGAVTVEQALHERYLREFGIDPEAAARVEAAPDCFAYTSFLLAAAYHEPWEVLVAALLPCFRIYWDVGCAIAGMAAPGNPFQAWIDTYANPSFGEAVRTVMRTADRAAAPARASRAVRENMLAAHRRATQYEYLFWDGAYRRRTWPQPT
jgi:thiaminase (transcriptional activator TenA)